ncbi:MAG: AraC family transcriptional regulator [Chloroflexota bacterium]
MKIDQLAQQITETFTHKQAKGKEIASSSPDMVLLRYTQPTHIEATLYDPVVCLILQGKKEIWVGKRQLCVGAGQSLIVSHDIPVVSQVTQATDESPYLAMIITLDLTILRSLYDQIGDTFFTKTKSNSIDVYQTDEALFDALGRYLALINKPLEAKVLAPLLLKEIHFRLLIASHGGMLRQLLWRDSHASRIARAIQQIRREFRGQVAIPELAKSVGMSPSSFHHHFKSITETTPLQYQKELRLMEARRLLQAGGLSVSNIAYEVGYESPTQFSREYSRKFGVSPRADLTVIAV